MKKPFKKRRNQWTKLQHILKYGRLRADPNGEIIKVRFSFADFNKRIAYGVKKF